MGTNWDAIVIGGGSGGIAFARTAAGNGAKVLLVERDALGGTCVNRGCVPKKMLWSAANSLHEVGEMCRAGVLSCETRVDLKRLLELRQEKIAKIRDSYADTLDDCSATLIRDEARIDGPGRVTVDGQLHEAGAVVVATGGRPSRIDIPGADLADTSDDALVWDAVPGRLLVIGGGYIGCELAAIHAAFGSDVTIVNDKDRVLTEFSDGPARVAQRNMELQGIEMMMGTKPERIEREGDGDGLRVSFTEGAPRVFDKVLMATGRSANTDVLGALADEVELTEGGTIRTDDDFQSTSRGLYAIGDVGSRLPLTPVAIADGETLARNLFGAGEAPIDLRHVATSAFVLPPVGEVGQPDGHAQSDCFPPLSDAIKSDQPHAFWGLARDEGGSLSGVSIVGQGAHEAIGWAAQTLLHHPDAASMQRALAVHPSDAEEAMR